MKKLVGLAVLAMVLWSVPATAQELGSAAPGSVLQSGGGSLQPASSGLQGPNTQQLIRGANGMTLNQPGLSLALPSKQSKSTNQEVTKPSNSHEDSNDVSAILFLVIAAIIVCALLLWWLRARLRRLP